MRIPLLFLLILASCASSPAGGGPASAGTPADPRYAEVPLPAAAGWQGYLLYDNGKVGIWTLGVGQVFPQYATPEVIGLDDRGRCHVLISYSGKWSRHTAVDDGRWLGGLAHGDLDPRWPGRELYVGSQQGNIYQLLSWPQGVLDSRLVAHLPGKEVHTLVGGDLDPTVDGPELLAFTRPGALYRLSPTGRDGRFRTTRLQVLDARVRDALVLPGTGAGPARVVTADRAGRLRLLQLTPKGPQWTTLYRGSCGLGRIARQPGRAGAPLVLYSCHDDGRLLRHHQDGKGRWQTGVIFHGPQGPRGVAAGRFHADPSLESVALFGYSGRVQLLTRRGEAWTAETLFTAGDKGHWLVAAELDGRNATREILATGYGGRIVMLARPPGYGRTEAVDGGSESP